MIAPQDPSSSPSDKQVVSHPPEELATVMTGVQGLHLMRTFHSLRFRLALTFILIFMAVQSVLWLVGVILLENHLRARFDRDLVARARVLAEDSAMRDRAMQVVPQKEWTVSAGGGGLPLASLYVQMLDAQGRVLARSPGQPAAGRMDPAYLASSHRQPRLETQSVDDGRARIVTIPMPTAANEPQRYLQVCSSLAGVDHSVSFLHTLFALGLPAGIFTAMIAAWYVGRPAIRRIKEVSSLVNELTPRQLTRRLEPPETDDEVGQLVASINVMLGRLERGFKAQERFIYDASHELKTPVAVLLSEAQVLKLGRASPEDYDRFVDSVAEEMRRLGRLVESLLMLTRADGRQLVVRGQKVSMMDVVVAAARQCQPMAEPRHVSISVSLPDPEEHDTNPEMFFRGDPDLVASMINNLIRNAIRFSPSGKPVEVSLASQDGWAVVSVRDHGKGIPEAALEKIFERHFQVSQEQGRRGTGLGLTIARSVAELHGGMIGVENLDEGGCRFTVRLPLEAGTEAEEEAETES